MKISHGNRIYVINAPKLSIVTRWALANLRKYVNLSTLKCDYYKLIYPHLQYSSSLWRQASKTSLKPVQTL